MAWLRAVRGGRWLLALVAMGLLGAAAVAGPERSVAASHRNQLTLDHFNPLEQTPARGRFASLDEAARFYAALAEEGDWPRIEAGPLLRLGDTHPQVPRLRKRLWRLGDLQLLPSTQADSQHFDLALHQAVERFQVRHGAKVDAVVGPETRALLNVSPERRLRQLRLNQQRQAALQDAMQGRYVHVNLPEFRLRLVDAGRVRLDMKTIVGRRSRPSPELRSEIRSLVINPAWNVPRTIAFEDILPRLQDDGGYLRSNNLTLVEGWSLPVNVVPLQELDYARLYRGPAPLRFRQPPGSDNALGRIKFDFPNRHSVYLHDTPHKELFDDHRRALSSGCIRLEQPRRLADLLLADDPGGSDKYRRWSEQGGTRHLRLNEPVPLFITYWTAWLDGLGVVQFRRDLYRRDREALAMGGSQGARVRVSDQKLHTDQRFRHTSAVCFLSSSDQTAYSLCSGEWFL